MEEIFHSVTLDRERCRGCTNCVKRCPTEAIRVRDGKAKIIKGRCIDCGECIRICSAHAKLPIVDSFDAVKKYNYTIAMPAPVLFGQFNNLETINTVLYGLLELGFDDVFEVARAAEIVSKASRKTTVFNTLQKPVISSACPAVVRLIRVRYPELIDNLLPFNSPMELAARIAKKEAMAKTGLCEEDIGCVFISPCAAKMTSVKKPLGISRSAVDAVVSISDIYPRLVHVMHTKTVGLALSKAAQIGLYWGISGGEATAIQKNNYLAADGIENVINVLDNLEDEKLKGLDFVELNACSGGCTGGVLNVANPYMCITNLKQLARNMPKNAKNPTEDYTDLTQFDTKIEHLAVLQLDENRHIAFEKMRRLQQIEHSLYGMDCGACGAPSCHALAEDIVRGYADEKFCIYRLKDEILGKKNDG